MARYHSIKNGSLTTIPPNFAKPSLLYFHYKLGVNHQDCLKKEIL